MTPMEKLIAWCEQERESLQERKTAMEEGRFQVLDALQDITNDCIKDCERKISELDEIISNSKPVLKS